MSKFAMILNVALYAGLFIYLIWISVVWFQNPEWSQMQFLLSTWQVTLIFVIVMVAGIGLHIYMRDKSDE